MIKNWNTRKLKAEVLDKLVANGEIAGDFVEKDARRRLLGIQEPPWGAGYRRKIVASLLTHTVERKPNEVAITIGVKRSESSFRHGFFIELGSSGAHGWYYDLRGKTVPAHPFLRPAVFENARKIVALLAGL